MGLMVVGDQNIKVGIFRSSLELESRRQDHICLLNSSSNVLFRTSRLMEKRRSEVLFILQFAVFLCIVRCPLASHPSFKLDHSKRGRRLIGPQNLSVTMLFPLPVSTLCQTENAAV